MHKVKLSILLVMGVFGTIECGVMARAGKCRPLSCDPVPLDFEKLGGLGKWEILYSPNYDFYEKTDHELRDATPIVELVFRVDDRRTLEDNSTTEYTFISRYIDGIIYEEAVENGERHQFRITPVAITRELAFLYYRCSDFGDPEVDTRFIEIPRENNLTAEAEQYLLAVDKTCGFRGKLKKLPRTTSS